MLTNLVWLLLLWAVVLGSTLMWRGLLVIAELGKRPEFSAPLVLGWLRFWIGLALLGIGLYESVTLFMEGFVDMSLAITFGAISLASVLSFFAGIFWNNIQVARRRQAEKPDGQRNLRDVEFERLYPGLSLSNPDTKG